MSVNVNDISIYDVYELRGDYLAKPLSEIRYEGRIRDEDLTRNPVVTLCGNYLHEESPSIIVQDAEGGCYTVYAFHGELPNLRKLSHFDRRSVEMRFVREQEAIDFREQQRAEILAETGVPQHLVW